MSGYLTSNQIWGITLFVDLATDYTYVHLLRSLELHKNMGAKKAFEKLVGRSDNTVNRYYAYSGRYADNGFMASLNANNQKITLCGVRYHHHNGIVDRRIQTVTEIVRTIILHAQRYWPECVGTMIWPFDVKAAIKILKFLQLDLDGNTPTAKLYNIKNIKPNAHEYHKFRCPVYVMNSKLQQGSIDPPKWEPCSRVGVYLSQSPMHTGYVSLILNPVTGHVSPKYYVIYDKTFLTVSHMRDETIPPTWDEMCKNSVESATSDAFDLAELWFEQLTYTSEDPVTDNLSDNSGGRTLTSKGAANKPNLTKNSEGENKVATYAIARKSLPNL